MRLEELKGICDRITGEVGGVIVGKDNVLRKVMVCILADGHLLLEDYPGLAKTLMAKSFAQALGLQFKRVQFTPDLLPADISGSYILDRSMNQFHLNKGPIFTNILLADEINRAPPRTQSALLEAMQERQVTLEGETHALPRPFLVIGTQNPIEYEGTYPLPEAQVDRFLMRLSIGYPERADEVRMMQKRKERRTDDVTVQAVCDQAKLQEMQAAVEGVHLDDSMLDYIASLMIATRKHPQVQVGASPRGSLALMKLSSAQAAMMGRDYVTPDDVKSLVVPAIAHRLMLGADPWVRGVRPERIIESVLREVPVPKVG